MKRFIRMAIAGALLAGGLMYSGEMAHAARPHTTHTQVSARADLVGWLKSVAKMEKVVVKVGHSLEAVGKVKSYSEALTPVHTAQTQINQALSMYNAAPQPPAKYTGINKLLLRSLNEYKSGLAALAQGFSKHSNALIKSALKTITKGTKDQNAVAAQISKIKH